MISGTQITATIPAGATTGKISVVTPTATLYTNLAPFRITPLIAGFTPTIGSAGAKVVITGSGFSGATRVTFYNQQPAAGFTVDSDTKTTVSVPAGAQTGPIQVTTPGGTATSSTTFTVE